MVVNHKIFTVDTHFWLKNQLMVLDPSGVNCIRLLDGNILGDSKTLQSIHITGYQLNKTVDKHKEDQALTGEN